MALTVAECRQMVDACKQAKVPLFTAYYRRGQEKFKTIKEMINGGTLGEIRSVDYRFSRPVPPVDPKRSLLLDKRYAGGGLLYDVGSHMIDTLVFSAGRGGGKCTVSPKT